MRKLMPGSASAATFPLRHQRRGERVAPVAAWLLAIVAVVNIVSALTPVFRDRVKLLRSFELSPVVELAQNLALPAGLALLLTAIYLYGRRRGALYVAVPLLFLVGAINLLKGLDIEETVVSWALAGLLIWARDAFYVRSANPKYLSTTIRQIVVLLAGALAFAVIALLIAIPWQTEPLGGPVGTVRRAIELLSLTSTPDGVDGRFIEFVPLMVEVVGVVLFGLIAARVFRRPDFPTEHVDRTEVEDVVREHGKDTLSFFKLRTDLHYLFSNDREAMLSYRIERGMLMIAGDPVGPTSAFPELLRSACSLAETTGLKVGVVGASKEFVELGAAAGLRSLYMGDEAIVETKSFTLEGRKIKKVRQAVHRIERNGYVAEVRRHCDLSRDEILALEKISELWRDGEEERGFSMSLDSMIGDHLGDSIILIARNEEGEVGGYLHFVPTYGRAAVSLSFMRRDPSTPNGMTDFLVVRAIQLLGERGVEEVSLNFAVLGRLFNGSAAGFERVVSWGVRGLDRYFQLESLYRFNRKFNPRWEPRYLMYEGRFGLPRASVAALRAEGHLNMPRIRA